MHQAPNHAPSAIVPVILLQNTKVGERIACCAIAMDRTADCRTVQVVGQCHGSADRALRDHSSSLREVDRCCVRVRMKADPERGGYHRQSGAV
jgi:hypothetical protein